MDNVKEGKRHKIQALWALLTNSYILGFVQGKIYRGNIKNTEKAGGYDNGISERFSMGVSKLCLSD